MGWILSLLVLIAIILLLALFDGQRQPDWKYNITLNTIVSALATIGLFALMVPVTAGLGQLKWNRFRAAAHQLGDFDFIDQASRGPLGCLNLLLTRRGGLVESIFIVVKKLMNP